MIVTGDHLSMSAEMEKELGGYSHRRVYNCFLNAAAAPVKTQERVFTAMDMFPTTLAALGVQIEGDRLGIGTNHFRNKTNGWRKNWVLKPTNRKFRGIPAFLTVWHIKGCQAY